MKKIFNLFLVGAFCLVLTSCSFLNNFLSNGDDTNNDDTNKDDQQQEVVPTVTAKDFVAVRTDDREEVYTHYSYDGEEIASFTSLYAAINSCVNDGDADDYVLQAGSAEKLFVNYAEFSETSKDMFWYYSDGNAYGKYTMWEKTFWSDIRITDKDKDENTEDEKTTNGYITVFKGAENGTVSSSYNSYKTVSVTSDPLVRFYNQVQTWHICTEIESSATVDMIAYSGITKSEYTIKLSEAKITPAYAGGDTAYAYVGFITADAYNTSNIGIKCDTTTGNWYFYSGEASQEASSIVTDEKNCFLTSTWNEEGGYFTPDSDVTMTMELLTLEDGDGDSYIAHRLTMKFDDGRVVVKDYDIASLTQCGSIRFTCGLDIESDNTLVDYMCGAKFENLVVTSAVATMYEEMADDFKYGSFAELLPGVYDILNSNPETAARFHTIIYTPSCVTTDFTTPGRDVYGFSFDISPAK